MLDLDLEEIYIVPGGSANFLWCSHPPGFERNVGFRLFVNFIGRGRESILVLLSCCIVIFCASLKRELNRFHRYQNSLRPNVELSKILSMDS